MNTAYQAALKDMFQYYLEHRKKDDPYNPPGQYLHAEADICASLGIERPNFKYLCGRHRPRF